MHLLLVVLITVAAMPSALSAGSPRRDGASNEARASSTTLRGGLPGSPTTAHHSEMGNEGIGSCWDCMGGDQPEGLAAAHRISSDVARYEDPDDDEDILSGPAHAHPDQNPQQEDGARPRSASLRQSARSMGVPERVTDPHGVNHLFLKAFVEEVCEGSGCHSKPTIQTRACEDNGEDDEGLHCNAVLQNEFHPGCFPSAACTGCMTCTGAKKEVLKAKCNLALDTAAAAYTSQSRRLMYVNYLSFNMMVPSGTVCTWARAINNRFLRKLPEKLGPVNTHNPHGQHGLGVLFMDFPPLELVQAIMERNPFKAELTNDGDSGTVPKALIGAGSANWMSRLRDDAQLWELSIPASHDALSHERDKAAPAISAASKALDGSKEGLLLCQGMSFENQLYTGLRWFDVRMMRGKDGNLQGSHSGMLTSHTWKDVVRQSLTFLDDHESEFIVVQLKMEQGWAQEGQYEEGHQYNEQNGDTFANMYHQAVMEIHDIETARAEEEGTQRIFSLGEDPFDVGSRYGDLRGKLIVAFNDWEGDQAKTTTKGELQVKPDCNPNCFKRKSKIKKADVHVF